MRRDALWLALVLTLCASLAAVLMTPDAAPTDSGQDSIEQEELHNQTTHEDPHSHAAPTFSVGSISDANSTINLTGSVVHAHPQEVEVVLMQLDTELVRVGVDAQSTWHLSYTTNQTGPLTFTLFAVHMTEETTSDIMTVDLNRPVPDGGEQSTANQTDDGNSTSNETQTGGNETGGNQTGGGNETSPSSPTYDASDLGQFWLDVFHCQSADEVLPSDDLTTAAIEQLECTVEITMNETHITITSNGIPNHDFESTLACSQAGDCTAVQNYEWVFPRQPMNDTIGGHDSTNCPEANGEYECAPALGEIAIALNGVPFYGPEDGPGGDAVANHHGQYVEDRQAIELGVCHGHSGMGGTYHYHADANCMHWHGEENASIEEYDISTPNVVASNTANGSHSAVIGVAFDGYPVYGFWGFDEQESVVQMTSSYRLKAGENGYDGIDDYEYIEGLGHLDQCNGHFGPTPEFPDGIYHYHSTMLNGEGEIGFPYFLLCYHGVADLEVNGADGGGDVDCSGFGETWGPGIGPPPPGCENGPPPNGQLNNVERVDGMQIFSMNWMTWLWFMLIAVSFSTMRTHQEQEDSDWKKLN